MLSFWQGSIRFAYYPYFQNSHSRRNRRKKRNAYAEYFAYMHPIFTNYALRASNLRKPCLQTVCSAQVWSAVDTSVEQMPHLCGTKPGLVRSKSRPFPARFSHFLALEFLSIFRYCVGCLQDSCFPLQKSAPALLLV